MAEPTPTEPLPPSGQDLVLPGGVVVPASAMRFQASRSSGPGGQNVNKVNTRIELWVSIGAITGLSEPALARLRQMAGKRLTKEDELHLSSGASRSQETNRQTVLDRLSHLLASARVEPKRRRKTKPSKAAQRRRLDQKRQRAETKSRRRDVEW